MLVCNKNILAVTISVSVICNSDEADVTKSTDVCVWLWCCYLDKFQLYAIPSLIRVASHFEMATVNVILKPDVCHNPSSWL